VGIEARGASEEEATTSASKVSALFGAKGKPGVGTASVGAFFKGPGAAKPLGGGFKLRPRAEEPAPEEAEEEAQDWAEEDVLELAKEHLGRRENLFYAPKIPSDKEKGAREAHRAHLPRDERVLVLYDATLFGGADDGFVLTNRRVCWKCIALDPQCVTYDELDTDEVGWDDDEFKVHGEVVQVSGDDPDAFLEAFGELVCALAGDEDEE
jgi:hypothetical protein